jgi:hypothetical protein
MGSLAVVSGIGAAKHRTDALFSLAEFADLAPRHVASEETTIETFDTSNTAVGSSFEWVAARFRTNPSAAAATVESRAAQGVLEAVDSALVRAVREDLREPIARELIGSQTVTVCLNLARWVSSAVRSVAAANYAVFVDEGIASLVIHSKLARRQVTFEVSPHGKTIRIVTIDEHMRRLEYFAARSDEPRIRESVAWLRRQS